MARPNAAVPTITVPPLVAFCIALAVLYFGRQILIPLALAGLLAFLLTPVAKRLEAWGLPRVPAALFVLVVTFGVFAGIGYALAGQLLDIVSGLPGYRDNLSRKIRSVQGSSGGLRNIVSSIEDIGKELTTTPPSRPPVVAPRDPARSTVPSESDARPQDQPLRVELVEPAPNALQSLRNFLGPLLGPIETSVLVVVFAVFMLIDRDNLRNRLLGLIGQRQLSVTTTALNDAAQRVSRYLQMQFLVNASFGTVLALGLWVIGLPFPLLWGVLAMMLRFLPYVGTAIAATLPLAMAIAATDGWRIPILVIALFMAVELAVANVIEPLVYGAQTGLSAMAVLFAAVFWAALWGPVGLILSTPLTVCLSVLGRYSPHLQFLDILLGDQPVLPPDAVFYQRLLALNQPDAMLIAENYLQKNPLVDLYDFVIIPALALAERDRHGGVLGPRREEFIVQSINECVTELAEGERLAGSRALRRRPATAPAAVPEPKSNRVFCVPAHDTADEITSAMLAQIAGREGYPSLAFPVTDSPVDLLESLGPQPGDVVCVSSVPPLALTHARTVSLAIRDKFPDVTLLAGLWNYTTTSARTIERMEEASSAVVVTTLAVAMERIRSVTARVS